MTKNVDIQTIVNSKEIMDVYAFCRRYRLSKQEEARLIKLFGQFALKHELLSNARREPVFR